MLNLDYRAARPIYEQVRDGLRKLVVSGAIAQGEKLPSVRSLASSLAINPNTIQRAYEALEEEGYVHTEAGRGSYAAQGADVDPALRTELFTRFDQVAGELFFVGVGPGELSERLTTLQRGGSAL